MITVSKEEYWPTILADPAQHEQVKTTDAEFNLRSENVFRVLENTLIASKSRVYVQQWETELELSMPDDATLHDRKAAILYRLSCELPCTLDIFEKSVEILVGGKEYDIRLDKENQTLYIGVHAEYNTEVEKLTARIIPTVKNIVWLWKYETCTKQADLAAANPDYKTDLTPDGKWVYELPGITNGDKLFQNAQIEEFAIREIPNPNNAYFAFSGNKKIKRFYTRLPKMAWFDRTFHNTSLEVFDYNGETFSPGVISLAFNDSKRFRTFNAVFGKKISNAELAFSNCILDKASVLRIANSALPASSGVKITMGIHVDNQNDPEVIDALALMETNGWKMTVQWNGTATAAGASTWGMRRPPIYAKMTEIETSEGGTVTVLDWGHYATNAEENGYMEFASVEEAREYFNITEE